ncbi:MAG TPA: hypothetical protein PLC48_11745 [Ferruginibacter sp.]|nr:hypothetical protein [Ferruginibacter sp.]
MKFIPIINCLFVTTILCFESTAQQKPIWQNSVFSFYPDRIVQGKFTADAKSSSEIHSNYESPANLFQSPSITFKFSINGKDNEMKPGVDHHFNCLLVNGICETPLLQFGKQFKDDRVIPANSYLSPNTKLFIKLDMRSVLEAFKNDGFYKTYDGSKIFAADFKGIYVAGATEPMSWDFDNLFQKEVLQLKDPDGDGIYETTMILNEEKKTKDLASSWKLSRDISAFPKYESDYPITDALYNLALEEMEKAIEPDSTFRTGKEWAGVWTRDISYSIILSMAYLQPRVAKYSLLRKVKKGKIVQDTGTGGAYPVSTDRMIWATAAWELYLATGDKDWLQQAYRIIKQSADDDMQNAYDSITGMVRGESSFLDWREQTYPRWMQPADIYSSENLGTNAVHYHANRILAQMATILNEPASAKKYSAIAENIKKGINQWLWLPSKGYYGQFLYGDIFPIVSPRSEALGEALCVLFDIADAAQQKQIIRQTPVTAFGIPCIYPQIANIPPYHNNAVWPFVQSFWALAAAKAGNEKSVLQSMAAIYRPAAMFLTNKENFVADNGDYKGTQINSSNMLWSLAGSISLVHKALFGIQFGVDGLHFKPMVPAALTGKRTLSHFSYRNCILDIELEGHGNKIRSIFLDGKLLAKPVIPATLSGKHRVQIKLTNEIDDAEINEVMNHTTLPTVSAKIENNQLTWQAIDDALIYQVLRNGRIFIKTPQTSIPLTDTSYSLYQVIAIDKDQFESFASEPIANPATAIHIVEMEDHVKQAGYLYKGFSGKGFVEISRSFNAKVSLTVEIPDNGLYAIDFRYSNGNGPSNTENKCAIRTLKVNNQKAGTLVFPQRGNEEWSNWGYSNPIMITLEKGDQQISLSLEEANENMNIEINQAMLDYLRIRKIK